MFTANSTDSSLNLAIRYVDRSGPSVPMRRPSPKRWRGVAAALALAGAVVAGGAAFSSPGARPSAARPFAAAPVAGEFRLAPGNLMPPGLVVGDQ